MTNLVSKIQISIEDGNIVILPVHVLDTTGTPYEPIVIPFEELDRKIVVLTHDDVSNYEHKIVEQKDNPI